MSCCRDCVHYEVCKDEVEFHHGASSDLEVDGVEKHCEYFKPKSRFVELPCEVGQTVYVIDKTSVRGHWEENRWVVDEWDEWKVYEIPFSLTLFECGNGAYYLSREEAEKALEERSK